ncbi:MAG: PEGA domain-containing protein [Myxococcales bacterium]|nr:PEGA domain-containing protein [Myxococcales bacterium]
MRPSRLLLSAGAACALGVAAFALHVEDAGAQAPAPTAPTAPAKKPGTLADAKDHMDRGQAFFLEKKFAEAAVEFHLAWETKPLSTFLFNEGVCHEKLRAWQKAIDLFQKYLDDDPTALDRPAVQARLEKLKAELEKEKAAAAAAADAGAGSDGGDAGGDGEAEGGVSTPPTPPPVGPVVANIDEMKSIVVIESLPDGAPVEIWQRQATTTPKFEMGKDNPGWTKVMSGKTTLTISLPLGTYHVVLPKFQDYRATETDVTVAAATISQFKANLAQGAFFGVVKLRSYEQGEELRGAHVLVKRPGDKGFIDRGVTPYEESFESGTYAFRVELPGFKTLEKKIEVEHGRIDEQKLELDRAEKGLVRLEITGADEADVYLDGEKAKTWALGQKVDLEVMAGPHELKVKADDRKTWSTKVTVPKGKMVVLHTELKPSVPRGTAWTTAVFSAVFLGGGVYLGLQANKLRDELSSAQANYTLDQEDPRIKRGKYFAIGANGAYAVGGVLALISLYNFLKDPLPPSKGWQEAPRNLDPREAAPKPVSLLPVVSVGYAGLTLVGEF